MIGILLLSALSFTSTASHVDTLMLEALMHEKSSARIELLLKQHDQLAQSRLICKIQLREKIVPTECYRALTYEKELGLYQAGRESQMVHRLDETCERSMQASISDSQPQIPEENRFVSPSCRRSLAQLRRIWAYRQSPAWSGN